MSDPKYSTEDDIRVLNAKMDKILASVDNIPAMVEEAVATALEKSNSGSASKKKIPISKKSNKNKSLWTKLTSRFSKKEVRGRTSPKKAGSTGEKSTTAISVATPTPTPTVQGTFGHPLFAFVGILVMLVIGFLMSLNQTETPQIKNNSQTPLPLPLDRRE
jgi:hypothetical protein